LAGTGGTIYLPAGEFLFATQVNMNGGINIIGQGIRKTILLSRTEGYFDINHYLSHGGAFRFSGISFMGYDTYDGATFSGITCANIVDFRIDHCYFEGFSYTINIKGSEDFRPSGVVDHCIIRRGRGTYGSMYGVTSGQYDYSYPEFEFSRVEHAGDADNVFVENCYIEECSHAADAFGGGTYVIRYCTIVDCASIGGHGPGYDSSGRGYRCSEIYNNYIYKHTAEVKPTFCNLDNYSGRWVGIGLRGGGGMIFNNTFVYCRNAIMFDIDSGEIDRDGDGVITGADYPQLDQIHQRWIWDNQLIDTPSFYFFYGTDAAELVLEDRDFFLRSPSLPLDGYTYTPYQYPHPLTADSAGKPTPFMPTPTYPVVGEAPFVPLFSFSYPVFTDGFESGDSLAWSVTVK